MIISSLRYLVNGEISTQYICTDEDFEIASKLVKVYPEHSVFMFRKPLKQATVKDNLVKQFFDKLST